MSGRNLTPVELVSMGEVYGVSAVLTNASATIVPAVAGKRILITSIWACEATGNADTVTIRIKRSAGADDATANLFTTVAMAANETKMLVASTEQIVLSAGDSLKALSGAGARVNLHVSYRVEE